VQATVEIKGNKNSFEKVRVVVVHDKFGAVDKHKLLAVGIHPPHLSKRALRRNKLS
jgi:hypothetical protein